MDSNNIDDIVNLIAESTNLDTQEVRECILTELNSIDASFQNDYLKGLTARLSNPDKPINSIDDVVRMSESIKKEKNLLSTEEIKAKTAESESRDNQQIDRMEENFKKIDENKKEQEKEESEQKPGTPIEYGETGEPLNIEDYWSEEYFDIVKQRVHNNVIDNNNTSELDEKVITELIIQSQIAERQEEKLMQKEKCSPEEARRRVICQDIIAKLTIVFLREGEEFEKAYRDKIVDAYRELGLSDEEIEQRITRLNDIKQKSIEERTKEVDRIKNAEGLKETDIRRTRAFAIKGKRFREIFKDEEIRRNIADNVKDINDESGKTIEAIENSEELSNEEKEELKESERVRAGAEIRLEIERLIRLENRMLKGEKESLTKVTSPGERKIIQDNINEIECRIETLSRGVENSHTIQKTEELEKIMEQIEKLDEESKKIDIKKNSDEATRQLLSEINAKRKELRERRDFIKSEYTFDVLQMEKIRVKLIQNRIKGVDSEINSLSEELANETDPQRRKRIQEHIEEKENELNDCSDVKKQYKLDFSEEEKETAKREVRRELVKSSFGAVKTRVAYSGKQVQGLSIDDDKFIKESIYVMRRARELESNLRQMGMMESEVAGVVSQARFLTPKDRLTFLLCKSVSAMNLAEENGTEKKQEILAKRRLEAQKLKDKVDSLTRIEELETKWRDDGIDGNRLSRINDAAIDLFKNVPEVSMQALETDSDIKKRLEAHGITDDDKKMLMDLFNCVDCSDERTKGYGENPDKTIAIRSFRPSLFTDSIKLYEDKLINHRKIEAIRAEYQTTVEEDIFSKIETKRNHNKSLANITSEVTEMGLEEAFGQLTQDKRKIDTSKEQAGDVQEITEQ